MLVTALGVAPRSRVDWADRWIGGACLGDDIARPSSAASDSQKDMALVLAGAMLASFFSGNYRLALR
ncbi:hypothetical protein GIW70_06175 [Pseudomonas syringae]|nr:hypothetical protein [Pseudomonas syringae]MCF5067784.1 hypothetical protein [Pseudomonas syringae]